MRHAEHLPNRSFHNNVPRLSPPIRVDRRVHWWGIVCSIGLLWIMAEMPVTAQDPPRALRFQHLDEQQGLASLAIMDIVQDAQGFMWIGSQNGLCKYDGYRCQIFKYEPFNPNSLSFNYVEVLALDQHDGLWVGTNGGGLNRLDLRTEQVTRFEHIPSDTTTLAHNAVYAIHEGRDGTIWIGMQNGLLDAWHPQSGTFTHYQLDMSRNQVIDGIYEDAAGVLWLLGFQGLIRFDPTTGAQDLFVPPGRYHQLKDLAVDDEGRLWLGSVGNGLYRFDPQTGQFETFLMEPDQLADGSANYIQTLAQGVDGGWWMGTRRGGLYHFNPQTEQFTAFPHRPTQPSSLRSNDVRALTVSANGFLWVGTLTGGVSYYDPARGRFRVYEHDAADPMSLSHDMVMSIYEDRKGNLWVGTYGQGLNHLPANDRDHFQRFRPDPSNPDALMHRSVWAIYEHADGHLWLGTTVGLQRYDTRTQQFTRHSVTSGSQPMITVIAAAPQEDLWLGTYASGLFRFNVMTNTASLVSLGTAATDRYDEINALLEHDGVLWVGTEGGGLVRRNLSSGAITPFRRQAARANSLSHDVVRALLRTEDGRLWIGTGGGGLNVLDPETEQFTVYTEGHGLSDNTIMGLVQDDHGCLWMTTMNGLTRYDPATDVFWRFDTSDGLPSNEFNRRALTKSSDGTLYFGNVQGLVALPAHTPTSPTASAPIRLTNFTVFNQPFPLPQHISHTDAIPLSYHQNVIGFRFAVLDYAPSLKHRYQYRLEGREANWVPAGSNNTVTYTDLAPGDYTFRVRGAGRSGNWHETSVAVRIDAPYWKQAWFILLLAALGTGGLFALYRYRIHHLLQLERTRQRIANDLHDDIGSKMSSIALMLEMTGRTASVSPQSQHQIMTLSQEARDLVDDLRDTVWLVDAGEDTLAMLVQRMHDVAMRLFPETDVAIDIDPALPQTMISMEWRRNFFLFYKEALHNIERHAQACKVRIAIRHETPNLILHISDDGVGFDPNTAASGRGMHTMRARSQELGATFWIHSQPRAGTTVQLVVKTP